MAKVLTSCPHLRWLYIDYLPFHAACWSALAGGACLELQLLWIDCPVHQNGRTGVTGGDHNNVRHVLTTRTLSLCMINPDEKLKSSFIVGDSKKKAYDRLNGKKAPKMPSIDDYYNDYGDY
jgi:hypothetical protein